LTASYGMFPTNFDGPSSGNLSAAECGGQRHGERGCVTDDARPVERGRGIFDGSEVMVVTR